MVSVLRDDIVALYEQHYGRTPRFDQLAGLEDVARWLLRCVLRDGPRLFRTWDQAAREIGWLDLGDAKANQKRYRNQIARRLAVLRDIGWLKGYQPVVTVRGHTVGILIVASPAGVAQSVEATQRPPAGLTAHGA